MGVTRSQRHEVATCNVPDLWGGNQHLEDAGTRSMGNGEEQ